METMNKASELRTKYNDLFQTGIHTFTNLTWQIVVNETMKGKTVAFHPDVKPEGTEMVIAHETGGYQTTGVMFISDDYSECCDLCDKINADVFGITEEEGNRIVGKSMTTEPV